MAAPDPDDLPFDLVGCTVTRIEWPRRGFRMVLGGKTAGGRVVEGARLTFEEVANLAPLDTFLTARLTYSPPRGQRRRGEYGYTPGVPLRLPTRLTHLRRSRAARASYGDRVFARYYGAAKRGRRVRSPGFQRNSISRHSVPSSLASKMSSGRSRVITAKSP